MKTGGAQVTWVCVTCPECNEAFYDDAGQDWSSSSKGKTPGRVVTCDTCSAKFKLPSILGRL